MGTGPERGEAGHPRGRLGATRLGSSRKPRGEGEQRGRPAGSLSPGSELTLLCGLKWIPRIGEAGL